MCPKHLFRLSVGQLTRQINQLIEMLSSRALLCYLRAVTASTRESMLVYYPSGSFVRRVSLSLESGVTKIISLKWYVRQKNHETVPRLESSSQANLFESGIHRFQSASPVSTKAPKIAAKAPSVPKESARSFRPPTSGKQEEHPIGPSLKALSSENGTKSVRRVD